MNRTFQLTREERGITTPYESPKKAWDGPVTVSRGGVLVEVEPSSRAARRQRQRNLAAMGRKSRRTAFLNAFKERQAEQSVRGQARVYLHGTGTPAMRENVRREIHGLAGAVAERNGEDFTASLKRVEGELLKSLSLYGDDL